MDEERMKQLWDAFLSLGQEGLSKNHYDLAQIMGGTPNEWKKFLQNPEVVKHIEEEFDIIKESELKKMINNSANTNSVGRAQLMNALNKIQDDVTEKAEGPVFIYSYVPLSPEQEHAPNVRVLTSDIFDPTKEEKPQWIDSTNSDPTSKKTELF